MFFVSNLLLAFFSVFSFYLLGIGNPYILLVIFVISLPYKIKGNYYSIFGGEVKTGSIYSLMAIFQKTNEDAVSILSLCFIQYAEKNATSYFGLMIYQRAKKRARFFVGISLYQRARLSARFFIGICLFQESFYKSKSLLAIMIKQSSYKDAMAMAGIIFVQDALRSTMIIGLIGDQIGGNFSILGLGIRLSGKKYFSNQGIKKSWKNFLEQ